MSGDPPVQRSSLFGLVNFRPRLTVVLIFLTLTVAVVGYHIYSDSGTRRVEGLAREARRIFAEDRQARVKGAVDPAAIEERVKGWVGARVALPRDEPHIVYRGATRARIGKQAAAAVHFTFGEDSFLLLVVRPDSLRGVEASPLFSRSSFLSWERDGISYVFWEREGLMFFLVSDVDLTRTFDLVRRYFT